MIQHYILNESGVGIPCDDLNEWAQWYMDNHADHSLIDDVPAIDDPQTKMRVKTGYVGRDINGLKVLWQTIAMYNTHRRVLGRYNTKEDSVTGHEKAVAYARTLTDASFFAIKE